MKTILTILIINAIAFGIIKSHYGDYYEPKSNYMNTCDSNKIIKGIDCVLVA